MSFGSKPARAFRQGMTVKDLSARELNSLSEMAVRQFIGSGVSVRRYGDRIVIASKNDYTRGPLILKDFVVLEELDDYLRCVMFSFGTEPQIYDENLENDTPEEEQIFVAKPYLFQPTCFPDETITLSPPYKRGEIITARKGPTGLTGDDDLDISWMDINTAGRSTGPPRVLIARLTGAFSNGYPWVQQKDAASVGELEDDPGGESSTSTKLNAFAYNGCETCFGDGSVDVFAQLELSPDGSCYFFIGGDTGDYEYVSGWNKDTCEATFKTVHRVNGIPDRPDD